MQASGLEAASMRKRSAKTGARRLEAERFELDERTSQKRKAEGDPSLDSLAEWHREDEPHDEIRSSCSSVTALRLCTNRALTGP